MSGSWRNGDLFPSVLVAHLLAKIQFSGLSSSSCYGRLFLAQRASQSDLPTKVSSLTGIWFWSIVTTSKKKTPDLTQIERCRSDSRIAENTGTPSSPDDSSWRNLISGYRSRAEQEELYNEKALGSCQRLVEWRSSQHRAEAGSFQEPAESNGLYTIWALQKARGMNWQPSN